jgi:hypothetical protein
MYRREVETVLGRRPSFKTRAYHSCNDRRILGLVYSEPSKKRSRKKKNKVKKSSGQVTRPKALLKDMSIPPLQRQVHTSPTQIRAF